MVHSELSAMLLTQLAAVQMTRFCMFKVNLTHHRDIIINHYFEVQNRYIPSVLAMDLRPYCLKYQFVAWHKGIAHAITTHIINVKYYGD